MKNTLGDLNNHLFAEIERLGDEDLVGEELKNEVLRAKAITSVASKIIANGHLVLKAQKFADDRYDAEAKVPKMLQGGGLAWVENYVDIPKRRKPLCTCLFRDTHTMKLWKPSMRGLLHILYRTMLGITYATMVLVQEGQAALKKGTYL